MSTVVLPVTSDKIANTLLEDAMTHTPVRGARTVAGLVRRGKLLCRGRNMRKSHPLQAQFSRNPDAIFFHAEINCIVEAEKKDIDIAGCSMYVVRSLKDGSPGLSFPCAGCISALQYFSIPEVLYTDYQDINKWSIYN